jgi:hypothetical protein
MKRSPSLTGAPPPLFSRLAVYPFVPTVCLPARRRRKRRAMGAPDGAGTAAPEQAATRAPGVRDQVVDADAEPTQDLGDAIARERLRLCDEMEQELAAREVRAGELLAGAQARDSSSAKAAAALGAQEKQLSSQLLSCAEAEAKLLAGLNKLQQDTTAVRSREAVLEDRWAELDCRAAELKEREDALIMLAQQLDAREGAASAERADLDHALANNSLASGETLVTMAPAEQQEPLDEASEQLARGHGETQSQEEEQPATTAVDYSPCVLLAAAAPSDDCDLADPHSAEASASANMGGSMPEAVEKTIENGIKLRKLTEEALEVGVQPADGDMDDVVESYAITTVTTPLHSE